MDTKNISIIGLGGVGGYFGFKLNEASSTHNITFVARGKTNETVRANGLTLLSPEHENQVTRPNQLVEEISELSKPDLVLLCVKAYDLQNACQQLQKVVTKDTVIIPLMNGADIYDRMRDWLPEPIILPACVYVASHIKEKGVIEHLGKAGRLIYGMDPQRPEAAISWIGELFANSSIHHSFLEDAFPAIWTKFIFIASYGMVSARYNSSIGAVCQEELQRKRAQAIMEEIQTIASKKQIGLPSDIIPRTFEKAATFPSQSPTSLQLDVNSGKGKNELELFAGAILNMGRVLGIETPHTKTIYQEILELVSV